MTKKETLGWVVLVLFIVSIVFFSGFNYGKLSTYNSPEKINKICIVNYYIPSGTVNKIIDVFNIIIDGHNMLAKEKYANNWTDDMALIHLDRFSEPGSEQNE